MRIPLEDLFRYHPPKTQERIDKHNVVNNAALEFAKAIISCTDEEYHDKIVDKIQVIRMLANQAITTSDILKNSNN